MSGSLRLAPLGLVIAAALSLNALAQEPQPPPKDSRIAFEARTTAVVNADRSVTFTFMSERAEQVEIGGDFRFGRKVVGRAAMGAEATGAVSSVPMTRTADGVWTRTSEPVSPMIHRYFFVIDGTVTPTRRIEVEGPEPMPWDLLDIPHGAVVIEKFRSQALGVVKKCSIYLPPGYASTSKAYPVLYLLHGGGDGDYSEWVSEGFADNIMDYLLAKEGGKEMVVVMPDRALLSGEERRRLDSLAGRDLEVFMGERDRRRADYLLSDLMGFVASKYRVKKDEVAVAGLSGGAGETFQLMTSHPERFVAAGMFSASVGMGRSADYEPYRTIMKRMLEAAKGGLSRLRLLYVGVGNYDPLLGPARAMHGTLEELQIPHAYVEGDGAHDWPFWSRSLLDFAGRLSEVL